MANDKIVIKGAREHNLKNVSLTLPRDKFIVMTGLSGSGKSSLAFDTIYADGQRRYVESLSSYARMFLGRMDKPDVDEITGLSPAISIDQKTTSHNPRSTVGTVTEIYDYLRLLYARIGVPHCPVCGRVISQQSVDEMVDAVLKLEEGTRFQVLAPVVRQRKGTQQKELDAARRAGYTRVKVDGSLYDLDEEITLDKNIKHTVEVVVDRLVIRDGVRSRLADSLETALNLTGGVAEVEVIGGETMTFSQNFACPEHGVSISELTPRLFSFNNPQGACDKCTGLGIFMKVDEDRIIPNRSLSIRQGAIKASGWYYAEGSVSEMYYLALGKRYGFTLDTPPAGLFHRGAQRPALRHQRRKARAAPDQRVRQRQILRRIRGHRGELGAPLPRNEQRVGQGGDRRRDVGGQVPGLQGASGSSRWCWRSRWGASTSASSARCPSARSWTLSAPARRAAAPSL